MLNIHKTDSGIRFGITGEKPATPAPTVFVFAGGIEETLDDGSYFNMTGRILAGYGYLATTIDIPCHGKDVLPGEPTGIPGWRHRLEKGQPLIGDFTAKVSELLDHLIREGYTDPNRVAVIGTSRGGFLGVHWAAAEPRVRAVVSIAPVADLRALREFKGMEQHAGTEALALDHCAEKLAGRAMWVCIGNNDERVSTDDCIRSTRKVVAASVAQGKRANVELHVTTAEGHGTHPTAHDEAAMWILKQFRNDRQ